MNRFTARRARKIAYAVRQYRRDDYPGGIITTIPVRLVLRDSWIERHLLPRHVPAEASRARHRSG